MTEAPSNIRPVPARLREARKFLGLSVQEVAVALSISDGLLEKFESGLVIPADAVTRRIAGLYRRPVAWLCGTEKPYQPSPDLEQALDAANASEGDRAVLHDFAEWLGHAGPAPGRRTPEKIAAVCRGVRSILDRLADSDDPLRSHPNLIRHVLVTFLTTLESTQVQMASRGGSTTTTVVRPGGHPGGGGSGGTSPDSAAVAGGGGGGVSGPYPFEPDWALAPAAFLKSWLEERKTTVAYLADIVHTSFGTLERVIGLLRDVLRRERLGRTHYFVLELATGVPFATWEGLERFYRDGLAAGKTDTTPEFDPESL